MATKIYLSGGAINIEGVTTETLVINPAHFDWNPKGNNYSARDGIENQSYDLGIYSNIQDENGTAYTSDADVKFFLNTLVYKQVGVNPNNIPASYTHQKSNSVLKAVNKGQLNKFRLRPQVLNEHVESSREIQAVVDASTIVGQIFKLNEDNINGIALTMESAEGVSLDNFESYANSGALQAVWVKGGTDEATLETVIVSGGTKSMKLPLTLLDGEWVDTITSTDYTDFIFEFDFQQSTIFGLTGAIVAFFIGDGVNTKSFEITFDTINIWHHIDVFEAAMTEDGGTTDVTAITKIGYRVIGKKNGAFAYIDTLLATPPPGQIMAKLWDMGTDIPVTAVTSIDDGNQYTELGDRGLNGGVVADEIIVSLVGGTRRYALTTYVAGVALEIPDNTLLTIGNYYAITLHYIDTDVSILGTDPSLATQYYDNGYAFTAPDEATAITAVGEFNNLMFNIFSTQNVFINTLLRIFDSASGGLARESIYIEDKNMKVIGIVIDDSLAPQEFQIEFKDRVFWMPKGSKFEDYYNDDFNDSVASVALTIGYMYEPPIVNG